MVAVVSTLLPPLVFVSLWSTALSSDPCTVCIGGENITKPDKKLALPGFEWIDTCRGLATTIPLVLDATSPECPQVQSIGTMCGCPIPEDACLLCHGDPNAVLHNPENEVPLFQDSFPANIVPTCELVEANLHSTVKSEDALCTTSQSFLSAYCGCSNHPPTSRQHNNPCQMCPNNGRLNRNKTIDLFGFSTCGELDDAAQLLLLGGSNECSLVQAIVGLCECDSLPSDPCTMCRDGSAVPDHLFNKEIPFLVGGGPFGDLGDLAPTTCGLYEAYLKSLNKDDEMCPLAQSIGTYCGCDAVPNHCEFCPGEAIKPQYYEKTLGFLRAVEDAGVSPTCEFAETLLKQIPSDDLVQCFGMQQRAFLCGCNDGEWMYADTKNQSQKAALAWAPRMSGVLSALVSRSKSFWLKGTEGFRQLHSRHQCILHT